MTVPARHFHAEEFDVGCGDTTAGINLDTPCDGGQLCDVRIPRLYVFTLDELWERDSDLISDYEREADER